MGTKKLYIIGNGFDIAHGINTSYWNFRTYLKEKNPEFLHDFESVYDIKPKNANKGLWSELEYEMGFPDIPEMEELSEEVSDSLYLAGEHISIEETMDEYLKDEYGFIDDFEKYVLEWIQSINTDGIKPRKKSMIGANEHIYLSFNYTDLLEKVYKISEVLHIHGGVKGICSIAPILGHRNIREILKRKEMAQAAEKAEDEGECSTQKAVANYLQAIYKDTEKIIRENGPFFSRLNDVDIVEIVGWSAGDTDFPYFKKIAESIPKDAKWKIYYFDQYAYECLSHIFKSLCIENSVEYISSELFWDPS